MPKARQECRAYPKPDSICRVSYLIRLVLSGLWCRLVVPVGGAGGPPARASMQAGRLHHQAACTTSLHHQPDRFIRTLNETGHAVCVFVPGKKTASSKKEATHA